MDFYLNNKLKSEEGACDIFMNEPTFLQIGKKTFSGL
jgi:hypothetical protein